MLIGSPYFLEMIQLLTNILCDQVGILNVSLGVRMHIILPEPIGTRCTVSMPINDVEMRILLSSLCDGGIDFRFPITGWHVGIDPENPVALTNCLNHLINLRTGHRRICPQINQDVGCKFTTLLKLR